MKNVAVVVPFIKVEGNMMRENKQRKVPWKIKTMISAFLPFSHPSPTIPEAMKCFMLRNDCPAGGAQVIVPGRNFFPC